MKKLFYSKNEKILFWVSGYDTGNYSVNAIVKYLQQNAYKLADLINCDSDLVQTLVVHNSSRYKDMRVFFIHVEPQLVESIPDVFLIGEDWTMYKWLEF